MTLDSPNRVDITACSGSTSPVGIGATGVGERDDQDSLRLHAVEDAVWIASQGVEAVPIVTQWPTFGRLADGSQRDFDGRLEARRGLGAASLIPDQRLPMIGIGSGQEDDLNHGRVTRAGRAA